MSIEQFKNEGEGQSLREWLFGGEKSEIKEAIDSILIKNSDLTEAMFDSLNSEDSNVVKRLVEEYAGLAAVVHTPEAKARRKAIETEVARITDAAYDKEN